MSGTAAFIKTSFKDAFASPTHVVLFYGLVLVVGGSATMVMEAYAMSPLAIAVLVIFLILTLNFLVTGIRLFIKNFAKSVIRAILYREDSAYEAYSYVVNIAAIGAQVSDIKGLEKKISELRLITDLGVPPVNAEALSQVIHNERKQAIKSALSVAATDIAAACLTLIVEGFVFIVAAVTAHSTETTTTTSSLLKYAIFGVGIFNFVVIPLLMAGLFRWRGRIRTTRYALSVWDEVAAQVEHDQKEKSAHQKAMTS